MVAFEFGVLSNGSVAVWTEQVEHGTLVGHEVVELPETCNVSEGPYCQSDLQRERGFVPSTVAISDVAKPAFL